MASPSGERSDTALERPWMINSGNPPDVHQKRIIHTVPVAVNTDGDYQ
jgi:hypothetical protein